MTTLRRRGFLSGLTALAAPAIIRTPGLLMPVSSGPFLSFNQEMGLLSFDEIVAWLERMAQQSLMEALSSSSQIPVRYLMP